MKNIFKRVLAFSLFVLAVPAYVFAGVQGSYSREGSAQVSYGILKLKSLHAAGREPMVYGQIKGAIGTENTKPMQYSYYAPFYQDNEKPNRYYAIIPSVGRMILTISADQLNANIQVDGDIPEYFAADYRFNMKEVEFSEIAAVDLIQNAPAVITGLKGEYEIDVKDEGNFYVIKASKGDRKLAWFDVSKNFNSVTRTDIDPNVPVYTPDDNNGPDPVTDEAFGPKDCQAYLLDFLRSNTMYSTLLNEGYELRQTDFDSGATLWQNYFVLGKQKPGGDFVIFDKFSVGEDKAIHRLTNDGYKKVN